MHNFEMANLDEEIASLKEEIKGYVSELNNLNTSEARKELAINLFNRRTDTLNRLLDQQNAGNFHHPAIFPP